MRFMELVEKGREAEQERRSRRDAWFAQQEEEAREGRERVFEEIDAWLGDVADEFDVTCLDKGYLFLLRPVAWRAGLGNDIELNWAAASLRWEAQNISYTLDIRPGAPLRTQMDNDDRMMKLFFFAHSHYEEQLAAEIERRKEELATATGIDKLEEPYQRLVELAPERQEEWMELHDATLIALEEALVERDRKLDEYGRQTAEWALQCGMHRVNTRMAERLRLLLEEDATMTIRDLECAVDGMVHTQTVRGSGAATPEGEAWETYEGGGRWRRWIYPNMFRLSEPEEVTPQQRPELFSCREVESKFLYYVPGTDRAREVESLASVARECPPMPKWHDVSGGLVGGADVQEIVENALRLAGFPVPDDESPF